MKFDSFFFAGEPLKTEIIKFPESKPGVPFFHDIIRNTSHIVLSVSLPKCSETEAINFPGAYLVEWFDLRENGWIFHYTLHQI